MTNISTAAEAATSTTRTASSRASTHAGSKRSHVVADEPSPPSPSSHPTRPDHPGMSGRPSVGAASTSDENASPQTPSTAYATFRNVSACNRCRLRKNRCDQRLPRCRSCEKAGVHCVGYDPTTKREIPRSYTFYLESRVAYLEKLLTEKHISFRPGEAHEGEKDTARPSGAAAASANDSLEGSGTLPKVEEDQDGESALRPNSKAAPDLQKRRANDTERKLDNLVSNIGMVTVQGASDPRYLGSTSGISFARVFFAALRSSVSTAASSSDRGSVRASERRPSMASTTTANGGGGSMRDSFFGLQTRPTMKRAPFPDKELAERLVNLYFEHANAQLPVLHRGEFMELFETIYSDETSRSSRNMYLLNIVCAIGAGVIFETKSDSDSENGSAENSPPQTDAMPSPKRRRVASRQSQPEEYHASAVVHLESFLCSPSNMDGSGGGLEELQAVLLLASFAVLRPVSPGLWYIVGVALRLAVDLGLHHEDAALIDSGDDNEAANRTANGQDGPQGPTGIPQKPRISQRERGWREWICDLRRRLFWCVYSFDRLVSTCIGRPFGIADEVITTEFPSTLDDKYITKSGFLTPPSDNTPSYKHVSHHYFKLRMLQSEIQQVLQYQHAKMARRSDHSNSDSYLRKDLPSPYLQNFESFRSWRLDVHRRLIDWRESLPATEDIAVRFPVEFLELNYWQALITLYRQSLSVPGPLANEIDPSDDLSSPRLTDDEEESGGEEDIYLKVAEAGQKVLRLYRQLHCVRLVNYTYLATHHIFMAGVSFLYAIWHSPLVRMRLSFDDVDFTVYSAVSVLGDLMEKCPPAEACRDAFDRMSKATIKMCLSTTGFGHAEKNVPQRPSFSIAQHAPPSIMQTQLRTRNLEGQVNPLDSSHQTNAGNGPWSDSPDLNDMQIEGDYPVRSQPPVPQFSDSRQQQFADLPMSQPPSYNIYHSSPPSNPSQYQSSDVFESPQQQQQQQQFSASQTTPNQPPLQTLESLSELDFLDFSNTFNQMQQSPYHSNNNNNNDGSATSAGPNENPNDADAEFMSSVPPFDPSRPNGGGMDFRFGMGPDFQHDWTHGPGIDLFDGLFFGTGGGFGGHGA